MRRRNLLLVVALAPALCFADDTWSGVERIVAVGDVHGDFEAFTSVLRGAGVIGAGNKWTGGKTHLVQVGDIPDRGPDTRKIMDLLMTLEKQARQAGGMVHALIGNHEAMDMYGDLRYVTPEEFAAFRDANSERMRNLYYDQFVENLKNTTPKESLPDFDDAFKTRWMAEHPPGWVEHRAQFSSDGKYGKWIRSHDAVIKINDTVFLHGGISPKYANTRMRDFNKEVAAELEDFKKLEGGMVMDDDGPLWYRGLAQGSEAELGDHVSGVLERLGAKYIVIGHTPTRGMVTPRFGGRVLLIDVGLSRHYGSHRACLVVESGKQYAMHRGHRVLLPTNMGTDMMRYQQEVARLDQAAR